MWDTPVSLGTELTVLLSLVDQLLFTILHASSIAVHHA
jgi:hypothetical protein